MSTATVSSNAQKPNRLPRSVSEQQDMVARHGTFPSDVLSELQDLMNLRARGVFDDHDITYPLETIKRTQLALSSPNSIISINQRESEHSDKIVTIQSGSMQSHQNNTSHLKATDENRKKKSSLTSIQVRTAIVQCIDKAISSISSLSPENTSTVRENISQTLTEALNDLSSKSAPFAGKAKVSLSHNLNQARLISLTIDPYCLNLTKERISRHLDDAISIIEPTRHKKTQRKSLAKELVEYAAKDPTGSSLKPFPASSTHATTSKATQAKGATYPPDPQQPNIANRNKLTNIVKCIDTIRTCISETNSKNLPQIRERINKTLSTAMQVIPHAKDNLTGQAKSLLKLHLKAAHSITNSMTSINLNDTKNRLIQKLEGALAVISPAKSIRPISLSERKNLARKIIDYTNKNPLENVFASEVPRNTKTEFNEVNQPLQPFNGDPNNLDQIMLSIKNGCSDSELAICISPVQDDTANNLQITAFDRKKGKINCHFLISASIYEALCRAGYFAKYFTVRISRELKYFEKQLPQILRHMDHKPPIINPLVPKLCAVRIPQIVQNRDSCQPSTSAAIRRSIIINPRSVTNCNSSIMSLAKIKEEPTISELLELVESYSCTPKDLDMFFEIVENQSFLIYAHPNFHDKESTYLCELFTSSCKFIGTTKLSGEDILEQLRKRPSVIDNFEIVIKVANIVLPLKVQHLMKTIFRKIGLLALYDCLVMFIFDIYKKWRLSTMRN